MSVRLTTIKNIDYWKVYTACTEPPTTKYFRIRYGSKTSQKKAADKFYADTLAEGKASGNRLEAGGPKSRYRERVHKKFTLGTTVMTLGAGKRTREEGIRHYPYLRFQRLEHGKVIDTCERSLLKYGLAEAWRQVHAAYMKSYGFESDPLSLNCPELKRVKAHLRKSYENIATVHL
jgi:hypothetical protein